MFRIGEYVVYGCKGIHRILDTTHLSLDGISRDRLYYVMQPLGTENGAIYAPVDAEKLNMRSVMTKAQAERFLLSIPSIALLDSQSNKQREDAYKSCIRSSDPNKLMRVIKTLLRRKTERKRSGKRLTVSDVHCLEQAEDILFSELCLVLGLERPALLALVQESIG